jgi:hypothetical protein
MKSLTPAGLIAALLAMLTLQGCAVQKELVATGGSRADGTVKLAYEFNALEKPIVNIQQGVITAAARCRTWGYSGAEPFGGETRTCNNFNKEGCNNWLVTVEFQCTGAPPGAMK